MIKLQCIGCKKTHSMTLEEAADIKDVSICKDCGMPEIVVQAKSRRRNIDLRNVLR